MKNVIQVISIGRRIGFATYASGTYAGLVDIDIDNEILVKLFVDSFNGIVSRLEW